MTEVRDINHGHLFCGLGGGAKGFNKGEARVGSMVARFVCKGGIDNDSAACRDFERAARAPAACLDLFSREQYVAFHGKEPPAGWREQTPDDIRAFFADHLHILFLSAPCKGFSGLLPEAQSRTSKYAALNGLTLRGIWLALEAFKDDPIELVIFENVPRIMSRGRHLLDQIVALLRHYGYAVAETKHDCGEIGGLGQSRKRFLLVARHEERIPPFLHEPEKRSMKGVGDVIGKLPVPGPEPILPMHRMPSLQWKTWVRLAFVEAGSDWRSLNRLAVEDGFLSDFGIVPDASPHNGGYGVRRWEDVAGTVTSNGWPASGAFSVADPRAPEASGDRGGCGVTGWPQTAPTITSQRSPGQGRFAVADPRVDGHAKSVQIGVRSWDRPSGVVTGKMFVGGGPNAVADPRVAGARFNNLFRIVRFGETSPAIAGPGGSGGGLAVSDPRPAPREDYKQNKYRITRFDEPAGTVIAASTTGNGAFALADPRTGYPASAHRNLLAVTDWRRHTKTATGARHVAGGALSIADPRPFGAVAEREHYKTGGHYGVLSWQETAGAVPAYAKYDRGRWSVADPRFPETSAETQSDPDACQLPAPADRLLAVIRALDGTWHRPFTTLELAALQGLVDADETLELEGQSDSAWRERIGNAVPPPAAQAIAGVMGRTLLQAWAGETFMLSSTPIWVRDVAVALSVDQAGAA
ncbi:DNA cytosine methyltransferase [Microbaculum marinum]|uniref:DNA (cytosine-5-)-methyltransferase n=1 Tax=Microbaculum marinum TaxID=1764581 RepID=A0AAW9RCJ8_9HYPH